MAPVKEGAGWKDLVNGGALQCIEAATLGMPLEVWKTRMGRFRNETTIEAFKNIYKSGGARAFWRGTSAKMVESASKGAILLYSKELIYKASISTGLSPTMSGFLAGAGGGVCQTTVMGPCTFLITCLVTGDKKVSLTEKISKVWKTEGLKGFYPGGSAIAFRQATNWASRQGFTEWARGLFIKRNPQQFDKDGKRLPLPIWQEAASGIIGGVLSAWNHPFEVARIEMQAAANEGRKRENMIGVFKNVVKEQGVPGLFKGVVPRIFLSVWQTLFMVTGAKIIQERLPW